MKYLYINKETEGCHAIAGHKGWFGRPVHTSERKALLDEGFVKELPKESQKAAQKPKASKEVEAKVDEQVDFEDLDYKKQAEVLGIPVVDENGKKLHHEKVKKAIQEALIHEEGQAG